MDNLSAEQRKSVYAILSSLQPVQRQSLDTILDNCKCQGGKIKLLSYEDGKVRIELVDDTGFIAKGVILPDGRVIGHYNKTPQWPKSMAEGR